MQGEESVELEGTVERVTFQSPDTGYSVLRVQTRTRRELITVVGVCVEIRSGEGIEAVGTWVQDREYGQQFKATRIQSIPPSSLDGIEKYLASGLIKGIGPHFASQLVRQFQKDVFQIIDHEPGRLTEVPGIGRKRIAQIAQGWKTQKVIRSIMVFLHSHGISATKAVRIFKTYGEDAVAQVSENPYRLARDIQGIGFKSADAIAQNLGIKKNSPERARAGLQYVMLEQTQDGHCAFPVQALVEKAWELLGIELSVLGQALTELVDQGELTALEMRDTPCVSLKAYQHWEEAIAKRLKSLMSQKPAVDIGGMPDTVIAWSSKPSGLKLHESQVKAIRSTLGAPLSVITGGPGTGKSTLTKRLVEILSAHKVSFSLCSPTGRAAKRLGDCTDQEAKTAHRLLGFDPKKGQFIHDAHFPLTTDYLIVDESSMVDLPLFYHLLQALPSHANLLLIGDVDQLPSVGAGQVLADLIESGVCAVSRLTQVFRQAKESKILTIAHEMKSGTLSDFSHTLDSDFYFIASQNNEDSIAKIKELVSKRIPQKFGLDPIRDIQVLCPMQRGSLGVKNLNTELQALLNPDPKEVIEKFGYRLGVGDKVLVTQNDYDKGVFNGDLGYIKKLDLIEEKCLIAFEDKEVTLDFGELDLVQLAYTITVHKSQGSEYPAVIIPLSMQHFVMLKRNLIYTALTRGKKLVVIVGESRALAYGVKTEPQRRWTNLREKCLLINK